MHRALLGVRQSHQGIPKFPCQKWSRDVHRHGTSRPLPETRRCASSFAFSSPAPSRRQARAPGEEVTSDEDFSFSDEDFSEGLKRGIVQALSRQRKLAKPAKPEPVLVDYPPPGSALYGKWQSLSLDGDRLLYESDVNVSDPRLVKQIDQPGNENDIELWSCLLEFAHRRMGRDGVLMIWQSLFKRRSLYQVEGALPQAFWRMVLNAAMSSDAVLRDVLVYAEWLYETHDVRWPQLYSTVMSYMLEKGHKSEVIRWHVALNPTFGPDEAEFVHLMKKFITVPYMHKRTALQTLYRYSGHRKLYDILIPQLYAEGHAKLAMEWRKVFCSVNDVPASLAARPFLRYMGAYYSANELTEDELTVAGLVGNEAEDEGPTSQLPDEAINGQNLSYLINRVHGETFGIQEKPYNDKLGAKWFASSWVPLDFAINVIYTMGIQEIGVLSLQSIALREGTAQGVLRRIDQLQQLKIHLPRSNYVKAIRHYAAVGDNKALQELLHSDIHPDVFDDDVAQKEMLSGCLHVGNWKTYRLILRTRLAVLSGALATSSDRVVESCARQGNGEMALQVLQEMSSHQLELAPMTSHIVSSFVLQNLSPHAAAHSPETRQHVDLQVSICRQLAATRFPPAVEVWQTLLYRLGREHRLLDLERLSHHILRLFTDYATSDQPMWISHMADVPQILRSESPYPNFQKLPRDLPIRHEKHPLRQIFDQRLQSSIVRWGFMYTRYDREAEAAAAAVVNASLAKREDRRSSKSKRACATPATTDARAPAEFHFARGIRLLAMLRDRGLFVTASTVRTQATRRLVDLYRGGGRGSHEWVGGSAKLSALRRKNRLSLAEAQRLCNEAWGSEEIVPSLVELSRSIEMAERGDEVRYIEKRLENIRERE